MATEDQTTPTPAGQSDQADAGEIIAIVEQLKKQFNDRDMLYQFIDRILHRDTPIDVPDAYKKTALEVHSPLPIHIANTITAALSINPPSVQFEPVGFGDSYIENATLREHFFEGSWKRQEQESGIRLFRKFMYALVTKGTSVLKTVERSKTAWADYTKYSKALAAEVAGDESLDADGKLRVYDAKTEEFKRAAAYPIRTTFVAPGTFYYLPGEDGISVAAEVKQVPYLDTLARYSMGLSAGGRVVPEAMGLPRASWKDVVGDTQQLTMIEYWDWREVVYLLLGPGQIATSNGAWKDGTVVKRLKHGYGRRETRTLRGPYFHCLGISTDSPEHHQNGISVLYGFLELFPLLDSLLTIRGNSAYMTGFASFKRKYSAQQLMQPAPFGVDKGDLDGKREQIEPGTIYPDDVEPIQMPTASQDFREFVQDVRQLLDLALPAIVQGVVEGDQSGYAANQAAHLARLAWDPIVDNAEDCLGRRVGFESWLIDKKIKEPVYVWGNVDSPTKHKGTKAGWLGIGPDDLKGVHRYGVKLNPETPSNKIIEVRTHQELLALRLETRAQAITELGGNPDEVERGLLLEDLKQDPAIKSQLTKAVFQELATIDQNALTPKVNAVAAQGGAPNGQPPDTGLGGSMAGTAQVFMPGQGGQPLTPTPPGAVTGAGPMPAGMPPGQQGPPQNYQPLPGQG